MSAPQKTGIYSLKLLALDLLLCTVFFTVLFNLLHSHVPSNDSKMVVFWTVLTGLCMSCVFWLAIQMFRVVLRAQKERNAKRASA